MTSTTHVPPVLPHTALLPVNPQDPLLHGRTLLAERLDADAALLGGAVVVVTGAAGGIGREICSALTESGAVVVAADLPSEALDAVPAALRVAGDLTAPDAVTGLVEHARALSGRLDVVVNNAGVYEARPLLDLEASSWRRVLAVNLELPVALLTAAARVMRGQPTSELLARRGLILNVSSAAADQGRPPLASYAASKAALNNVSRTAAMVLEPDGVAVTTIYPGNVREGMWRDLGKHLADVTGRDRDELEAEREFQPADEVARLVRTTLSTPGTALTGRLVLWDGRVTTL